MPLQLYNSLSQAVEPVTPLTAGKFTLYACGVTVYDDPHLGHLRAAFIFELLRRAAQAQGWAVTYVRNLTDLDDKIIERARAEASASRDLKAACRQVATRYTERYHQTLTRFGLPAPDQEPKATEHLPQMIQLIKGLVARHHAYSKGGDVYFRVRSWPAYGRLSRQSVDELRAGARIPEGESKDDPLDFALWKASKPEEPAWESPWGLGRPGWHIECSAMSMTYLGESLDVHGGGRDLIFPHHENEIAQSEAYTGRPFVRCWVHSGLVTVGGQKMAKSVGNVIGLEQILARHPNPDVLKLLMLMTHYSSPLDFTWEKLDEAAAAYKRFTTIFDTVEALAAQRGSVSGAQTAFETALADNLNTPQAVAALFELVRLAHEALEAGQVKQAAALVADLRQRGRHLGLFEQLPMRRVTTDTRVKALVERRNAARQAGNFQEADRLRQEIQQHGFIVEDTGGGTICRPAS